ncbi:hypothetical protein [Desulfogranum japonicum]|uniref:hypothetical protein n=1 Tax=Desulfogranum japonicum TaxID=231447 RepID=UPI00042A304C|nr:hypothetical protein [Desulfogranum japonicum]
MKTKKCPMCGGRIKIYYDHEAGDEVYCEECEREFQLISLTPIRLDLVERYEDHNYRVNEY